jgi:hypothetical protein
MRAFAGVRVRALREVGGAAIHQTHHTRMHTPSYGSGCSARAAHWARAIRLHRWRGARPGWAGRAQALVLQTPCLISKTFSARAAVNLAAPRASACAGRRSGALEGSFYAVATRWPALPCTAVGREGGGRNNAFPPFLCCVSMGGFFVELREPLVRVAGGASTT